MCVLLRWWSLNNDSSKGLEGVTARTNCRDGSRNCALRYMLVIDFISKFQNIRRICQG